MNKKRPELAHFRKTFYEIVPRSRKIKTNFRYINEQRGAGEGGAHNLSPSGSDPPNPTLLIFGPSATLHSANKRRSHTFRSMGSHFRSLLPFSLSIRSTFSLSLFPSRQHFFFGKFTFQRQHHSVSVTRSDTTQPISAHQLGRIMTGFSAQHQQH